MIRSEARSPEVYRPCHSRQGDFLARLASHLALRSLEPRFFDHLFVRLAHLRQAEVDHLQHRGRGSAGEDEVLRLYVSMDDPVLVAVVQTSHDLGEEVSGLVFGEEALLSRVYLVDDAVEEFSAFADLENEVHVADVFVGLVELDDVGVVLA